MKQQRPLFRRPLVCSVIMASVMCSAATAGMGASALPAGQAQRILAETGVRGGFIVHVGCGTGELTTALRARESYLVHGLDMDAENVRRARAYLRSQGRYGMVSVDHFDGRRLPYVDNFVNLVVSENLCAVPMEQVMRVLAPAGVAYIKSGGTWKKTVKPRPAGIDAWTHFLYDATNNAVSQDQVVAPPAMSRAVCGTLRRPLSRGGV